MPTPELSKAQQRQRKGAQKRRARSNKTVDRTRRGQQTTTGLAALGEPPQAQRMAMDREVNRIRRRCMWLVAFSVLLAVIALWYGRLLSGDTQTATTGVGFTAFGAAVVTAMMWARVVSAIRSLGLISGRSPQSVTPAARSQVMVSSAVTVITSGLSVTALVWMCLQV